MARMKKRVVVAMSGGVDSSVAAALLQKQGYEVIGMTMCFNLTEGKGSKPSCCSPQGIEDARRVAYQLGLKHYVVNMQAVLRERVIADFCREYLLGRTPNPCVRCNQFIKFDALLQKAFVCDADYLATGHYARLINTGKGIQLVKGRDPLKDQSYFLYRLSQKQLRHVLFPIGGYTKDQVRGLARQFGLPVAHKNDSQEVCFLPDNDYRSFLKRFSRKAIKPGPVVDGQGRLIGQHRGIPFYTVGQRQGLGIAAAEPLYITQVDVRHNRITVGSRAQAFHRALLVSQTHFVLSPLKKRVVLNVRIRYNHKEARAQILPFGRKFKVQFFEPQFAIAPGQSAVFFKKDRVLGGGIIEKVLG